jgi:hypothetical protein
VTHFGVTPVCQPLSRHLDLEAVLRTVDWSINSNVSGFHLRPAGEP